MATLTHFNKWVNSEGFQWLSRVLMYTCKNEWIAKAFNDFLVFSYTLQQVSELWRLLMTFLCSLTHFNKWVNCEGFWWLSRVVATLTHFSKWVNCEGFWWLSRVAATLTHFSKGSHRNISLLLFWFMHLGSDGTHSMCWCSHRAVNALTVSAGSFCFCFLHIQTCRTSQRHHKVTSHWVALCGQLWPRHHGLCTVHSKVWWLWRWLLCFHCTSWYDDVLFQ